MKRLRARRAGATLVGGFCALVISILCLVAMPASAQMTTATQGGSGGGQSSGDGSQQSQSGGPALIIETLRDSGASPDLIADLQRLSQATDLGTPDGSSASGGSSDGGAQSSSSGGSSGGGSSGSGSDSGSSEGSDDQAAPMEVADTAMSLGRQVATVTQATAERLVTEGSRIWQTLQSAPNALDGLSGQELPVLFSAFRDLLLVIVSTVATFIVLRWIAGLIYRRLSAKAEEGSAGRTLVMFVVSAVIDVIVVALAWAAGYLLGVLVFGDFGTIAIRQTLYLNAFLLVELAKVVVRLVLSPAAGGLRPLPMSDYAAKKTARWLGLIVGLLGYGNLLIVPIINENISTLAGVATATLIALVVLIIAVYLVLRHRKGVARWILAEDEANERRTGPFARIARRWHWFALLYLLAMFVIVLGGSGSLTLAAFSGSGKIALALLVGLAASRWITKGMVHGVTLPDRLKGPLPLLETRLNKFVPRGLFVLRMVILLVVVITTLDILGLFDFRVWLASQFGIRVTSTIVSVLTILLVAFLLWIGFSSWVDYRLSTEVGKTPTSRETTLLTLLRNAVTIAIILVTLMFVLSELGLNIGPLLASAGVLGLAIGFGAQKLVQDIITGIFIQFENAMNVGDVVTIGGLTGTVERLTIRSASVRDLQGTYHLIPFSAVDVVSNYMRDFGYFVADVGVAYGEDIGEAKQAMTDAFEELKADEDVNANISGDYEWFGLNTFGDSALMLRGRIKCKPGTQWGVGRRYNEIVKRILDERGIEIPFPHRTIVFSKGDGEGGNTQTGDSGQKPSEDAPPD